MNLSINTSCSQPNVVHPLATDSELVQLALGNNCLTVYRTSVPPLLGTTSKPTVHILAVVKSLSQVEHAISAMQQMGYQLKGDCTSFRRYFQKETALHIQNIHVFAADDPKIDQQSQKQRPTDSERLFFAEKGNNQRFNGLRSTRVLTSQHWYLVQPFRQHYFTSQRSTHDTYRWLPTEQHHIHLAFYKWAKIIGYAHIQLGPGNNDARIDVFAIDQPYRRTGTDCYFLKLCVRWLLYQDRERQPLLPPLQ